ncbi:MAG: hypothetical protein RXO36_08000 [Candidatus Nanopusillus acidilobi]
MNKKFRAFIKKYGIPYPVFQEWVKLAKEELGKESDSIYELLEVLE